MMQSVKFKIVEVQDGSTQFTAGKITITITAFSYNNGRHEIAQPYTASCHFICNGKSYTFVNIRLIDNVEEWYLDELLPKYQMLELLTTDTRH